MPSTLAWLDHDTAARDRTRRILALFQEQGTQDQLGLGGIRDSFANLLFPGTSTIQTRLRYFLIVPWIYVRLEEEGVPSHRFGAEARRRELSLVQPLVSTDEGGVFGRSAGGDLKRLPSEVYWGGLGSWRIRRFDASQEQYHGAVDEIYRRRKAARRMTSEGEERELGVITWHPELPPPPDSFPESLTLSVTRDEAAFLRDRIVAEHPQSLLAWLALQGEVTDVAYGWDHPLHDAMPPEPRRILDHAEIFSAIMLGAAILYNWTLCEAGGLDDKAEEHGAAFSKWAAGLDRARITNWDLTGLFAIARSHGGFRITPPTEDFVRRWVSFVREDPARIPGQTEARRLIKRREIRLKGPRSFFRNRRALEERYGGALGLGRLNFRWLNVQVLLNDLFEGLGRT